MNTQDVKELYKNYVLGNYAPENMCIVKGKGSRVWDIEGNEYLDFFPGWAVCGLGHCHPAVVSALRYQAGRLIHLPNNYHNLTQAMLAKEISENSFPAKVFFCNSGAEAIEAAIKFARRYGSEKKKFEIITTMNSFHGRTLAAATATGQPKYQKGFEPLPAGFKYAKFNDLDSLKALISDQTIAILFEPVQGEGGINIASKEYMQKVRKLCDEKGLLLILDEVQTGMGRTGKMFAYQHYGIEPDLMTLAKSLGGGVPIGALVVNNKIENVLVPGTHASTFGGNPLVTRAALSVFKTIKKQKLLKHVEEMSAYIAEKLKGLKEQYAVIKEIRICGLMVGIELTCEGRPYVERCIAKRLLINCTQGSVLRIIPAMVVTKKEIDKAFAILSEVFKELS
ncbi:MAG: aspartate aminotransferase family protein [Candidatus Omnitrophica bacterium]|nr:aspartate aminotransferase family protein [Candidatus Omnitrophota bacterium]